MTDLPPDVRDRAAHELYRSENYNFDQWGRFPSDRRDVFRARVDAVVAVVAPEIARPLQARIEELEATLRELFAAGDNTTAEEGEAIRARVRAVLARGERP